MHFINATLFGIVDKMAYHLLLFLQCHGSTGHCWCVDSNGQERAGTRTPPGAAPVNCDRPGELAHSVDANLLVYEDKGASLPAAIQLSARTGTACAHSLLQTHKLHFGFCTDSMKTW